MIKTLLKTTLVTSVLTVMLLFVVTFIVYRFDLSEKYMEALVVLIYIISNFLGGYIIGKVKEYKKYLYGALVGVSYVIVLLVISAIVNKGLDVGGGEFVIALIACVFPAMLGGAVS